MYFTLMSKPIKGSQHVSPKAVSRKNIFFMGQLNNLVLCYGVMCILTRKYQGAFCCSRYDVESLLHFMFSFKYESSL